MAIQRKMGIKAFSRKSAPKDEPEAEATDEEAEEEAAPSKRKERAASDALPTKQATGKHRLKKKGRDPRFDRLSGHFNEDLFQKAYGFIDDYRQSELQQMKQELKKTKQPEKAAKLQHEIKRLESKEATRQETKRMQELKRRLRKEEAEKVKQGKKPYFIKRSEFKRIALVDKYEQLAKHEGGTAKLDRILEKRRKRNAAKERKGMPKRRRTVAEE
ncbi:hypothetical protein SYNPS1DRAFT_21596 [Syncephalis pseudoplumigaleata]|uniref:rRNA biogenesis protein RRP36 n=1 Tax=Syncephalis pseudoplumigaleata TaxID=1712513 RepID=A0A4P9Z2F0_9FUNG|nr:hypothetical protein SYNPS1DRAFT_21596 [Syncephalis pseudoplumigaleata]|eukprot:RKP26693.1 hypothetical protein SYNPS1DRAFT_21596 [Syncephalis pseudoplumigaleata]